MKHSRQHQKRHHRPNLKVLAAYMQPLKQSAAATTNQAEELMINQAKKVTA